MSTTRSAHPKDRKDRDAWEDAAGQDATRRDGFATECVRLEEENTKIKKDLDIAVEAILWASKPK